MPHLASCRVCVSRYSRSRTAVACRCRQHTRVYRCRGLGTGGGRGGRTRFYLFMVRLFNIYFPVSQSLCAMGGGGSVRLPPPSNGTGLRLPASPTLSSFSQVPDARSLLVLSLAYHVSVVPDYSVWLCRPLWPGDQLHLCILGCLMAPLSWFTDFITVLLPFLHFVRTVAAYAVAGRRCTRNMHTFYCSHALPANTVRRE